MKLLLRILVFISLSGTAFSQADTLALEEVKKKSNTNWRFGFHASYLNTNNSLGFFEVDRDFKAGFSFGPVFNIKISPYNNMRLEPYYLFQQFQNRYLVDNIDLTSAFTNHVGGMDFFPLVLKSKNKFTPTLSLGGYAQYHFFSKSETQINQTDIAYSFEDFNELQFGWVVGAGMYLNRTLLELRLYNAMVDFYPNAVSSNTLRSMSFIIAF
ncbi:outer membrane beta-barrel protein [Cecembia lonarensis]|uniref:Outer membrane protein beta-barrel domain-containing protein n=1 Tax=Cecembia lonarensis (strain CCUG 58316 / KCTC 22772 / LW9) TaxID=1225176 RepID=K1L5L7_CECL9|nr:outer membrane beta-barrel protein [Cecembia lonarensis]EKB47327.1 hypothetical protein B879_04070 [Cecembia lonarensis LW9]